MDLIPSQEPLRDRILERFALLARTGITSVVDLRSRLETPASGSGAIRAMLLPMEDGT